MNTQLTNRSSSNVSTSSPAQVLKDSKDDSTYMHANKNSFIHHNSYIIQSTSICTTGFWVNLSVIKIF